MWPSTSDSARRIAQSSRASPGGNAAGLEIDNGDASILDRQPVHASGDAADVQKLAARGGAADKAPFRPAVTDFYFTNPIARCSAVMAECSAIAGGRSAMTAAE